MSVASLAEFNGRALIGSRAALVTHAWSLHFHFLESALSCLRPLRVLQLF